MTERITSPTRLPVLSATQSPTKLDNARKRRSLLLQPGSISGIGQRVKEATQPLRGQHNSEYDDTPAGAQRRLEGLSPLNENESMGGDVSPRKVGVLRHKRSATLADTTNSVSQLRPPANSSGHTNQRGNASTSIPGSRIGGLGRSQSVRKAAPGGLPGKAAEPRSQLRNETLQPTSGAAESGRRSRPVSAASSGSQSGAVERKQPMQGTAANTGLRRAPSNATGNGRTISASTMNQAGDAGASRIARRPRPQSVILEQAPGRTRSARPQSVILEDSRLTRPAFSTNQQHYSPKKTSAPKPPVPASHSSYSQQQQLPAEPSSEISRLQTELLQLHLLHESSTKIQSEWEASAKRKLGHQFQDVAAQHRAIHHEEKKLQEHRNLAALKEWSERNPHQSVAELIQLLATLLQECTALTESGGRYAVLVGEFERWIGWVEGLWTRREQRNAEDDLLLSMTFVEKLGDAWKMENAALTRRLSVLLRELEGLSKPPHGTSIAHVVDSCENLIRAMVRELRAMSDVETDVGEKERKWVDGRIGRLGKEIEMGLVDFGGESRYEAWKEG